MSVTTRIAIGSGLLVLLMAAVLAYHIDRGYKTAAASDTLGATHLPAAALLAQQEGRLAAIDRNVRAFLGLLEAETPDPDYILGVGAVHDEVEEIFVQLERLRFSPPEEAALGRFRNRWRSYLGVFADISSQPIAGDPPAARAQWKPVLERVQGLRDQALELRQQLEAAGFQQTRRTTVDVEKAKAVSWGVVALALGLGVVVVVATARSIKRPLHQLIAATEAVAHGRFSTHLDFGKDREFAPLAGAFNQMVRRLSELDQMKKDFVAHVSHELKNPLVAMQETNQALADELAGPLNDRQKRLLSLNRENGRRLSAMLSNLLDLSSLEAGAMSYELKPTDLAELTRFAASVFEARAREQRLELVVRVPPGGLLAPCDRDRIIQVLDNLLDNAIKYSPAGGGITLSLETGAAVPHGAPAALRQRLASSARSWAVLRVADQGLGVPDSHKLAVFRRFHQVGHNARTHRGGVGLGLAICRELIEAHGGGIWVEDNQPQGSIFTVLLPAFTEHHEPAAGSAA